MHGVLDSSSEGSSGGLGPARTYCFSTDQTSDRQLLHPHAPRPPARPLWLRGSLSPATWTAALDTAFHGEGTKREARPGPEGTPRGSLLLRGRLPAGSLLRAQLANPRAARHAGPRRLCTWGPGRTPPRCLRGAVRSRPSSSPHTPGSPALGGRFPCIAPTRQVWRPLSARELTWPPGARVSTEGGVCS